MRKIGLTVPVVNNFTGLADLMNSLDTPVVPYIEKNFVKNLGVSKGWNNGIRHCLEKGCDFVFVANDDILLSPNALNILADRLEVEDDAILVTGRNAYGRATEEDFHELVSDDEGENPDYSCFMVGERYWDIVGEFDENFSPAYFEDNDSHRRIIVSGHKALNLGKVPVYHEGSISRRKPIIGVNNRSFERNQEYYVKKWGGDRGEETFDHPFNDESMSIKDW